MASIIIHVACAGVEHMGRIAGNSWKKMRKILVLEDAVRIAYGPDKNNNVIMTLTDMKKRRLGPPGTPVETKYEGTVYLDPRSNAIYIWPLKTGGDLHRIYMETISDSQIIQGSDKKIVTPSSSGGAQQKTVPFPMGPRIKH